MKLIFKQQEELDLINKMFYEMEFEYLDLHPEQMEIVDASMFCDGTYLEKEEYGSLIEIIEELAMHEGDTPGNTLERLCEMIRKGIIDIV